MDPKELADLGAAPSKFGASSSRKKTDENYGSVEKIFYLEVNLHADSKLDEIVNWVDQYVEGEVAMRINLWLADIEESTQQDQTPPKTAEKPIAPSPEPSGDGVATATMTVNTIKVGSHPDTGEKTFRVKGRGPTDLEYKGNWTKFGVPVYEALDSIGGYAIWKEKDLGPHDPTPGLVAICELDGKKPVKVIGFVREK